jgi:hypothetical protein
MIYLFYILVYALICAAILSYCLSVINFVPFLRIRKAVISDYTHTQRTTPKNIVFISYRAVNRSAADRVRESLTSHGFTVLMWQPDRPFKDPAGTVIDFIEKASAIVVIEPVEGSPWVKGEQELGSRMNKGMVIIPPDSVPDDLPAIVRGATEEGAPHSIPPWEREAIYNATLFSQIDPAEWLNARLPSAIYLKDGMKSGWVTSLLLGVMCELFLFLACISGWLGKVILNEHTFWGTGTFRLCGFLIYVFGPLVWYGNAAILEWILPRTAFNIPPREPPNNSFNRTRD